MPRFPNASDTVAAMPSGVFSKVAHRIAAIETERYPLHVGDTYLEPADGCHLSDFTAAEHPLVHTYAPPRGHPALIEAISARHGVDADRIIVTAGATGGLGALACGQVDPGEEVLILSPFWPLIRGIVQLHHGVPVEVPILGYTGAEDVVAALEAAVSERAVAVYINTPNNPTGRMFSEDVLQAVAAFARRHDLWLWSDEVYNGIVFEAPVPPVAAFAPERTMSVYSMSKTYGMAGNRVGYAVGPTSAAMASLRKATVHHFYSATTAAQLAAARVLHAGDAWLERAVAAYRTAGYAAADRLGVERPQGGTFLFVDASASLDERGLQGFLEDCIDRGLILAPGTSCGAAFPGHVRVCFTSAPPDVVRRGVDVLASLLGR
ncbi:MAG: pyridoxal phosphate-dependent aminotransferase [Myxococcota bacterium]|nr:pyridoxal phosphate-dependent aminotransferase [Myxococcota bacterium]